MNSSKYRFTLDVHSVQSQTALPAVKDDTNRTLYINFSDGNQPYYIETGCLAMLSLLRPSGSVLTEFCEIKNNSTVVYPFSQNKYTCYEEGINECEIRLTTIDGKVLTSPRFSIVVSQGVLNSDDVVISESDKTALAAILESEAARQEAERQRVSAETQREIAEEDRVNAEAARENAVDEVIEKTNEAIAVAEQAVEETEAATQNANKAAASVVSPTIKITAITGGHRVTVTDKSGTQTFDVMDGSDGITPTIKKPKVVNITLSASLWSGSTSPYSQVVEIEGIDQRSKVDLQPSSAQLALFHEKDIAFVAENEDGVITIFVIGDKPTDDYTIQATITEVSV